MKGQNHQIQDKPIHAYMAMMGQLQQSLTEIEEKAGPRLHEKLDEAKERLVTEGELSRNEADKIANYLWRDIHDAGEFLAETGEPLDEWLYFDQSLVEDKFWQIFNDVAKKFEQDVKALPEAFHHNEVYHVGEITGVGTLRCYTCGKLVHFHHVDHIPPCPLCLRGAFTRVRTTTLS